MIDFLPTFWYNIAGNKVGNVEHTGYGVSTIISKYGKEAFEIFDNYIRVTIPFNAEVLKSWRINWRIKWRK